MPLEPIRERVLAAVADRLTKISPESGYWTQPLVDRSLLAITQYKTHLDAGGHILGVLRGSTSTFVRASHDAYQHDFRFAVWGYVKSDGEVLAGTWLERLWGDHLQCLRAEPMLGGLVLDLEPDPEGTTDTDEGELEPYARFVQDWRAVIHEAA